MLKFITGNKGKFKEVSSVLDPIKIKQVKIDLEEIQELDPYKIIHHKLNEAFKHHKSGFFIDDTSTSFHAFKNKLPGPFMKWFLGVSGNPGLYKLARKMGDSRATMQTIIAYAKSPKQVYFFEGSTQGSIVKPKGGGGFGVDKIFKPLNSTKTLAQMSEKEKSKVSPRGKATIKFKNFLIHDKAKR